MDPQMNQNSPLTETRSWADRYLPTQTQAQAPGAQEDAKLIDIATIRGFLRRQRFVLGGVLLAALATGFLVTLLINPTYRATATLRIDPSKETIIEGQELTNQIGRNSRDFMETLTAVTASRTVALQVATKLKLDSNATFLNLEEDQPQAGDTKALQQRRLNRAAGILMSNVVATNPTGDIMAVSYLAGDPELATKIANAYAEALLKNDLQVGLQKNAYALNYLSEQIKTVRNKLALSERDAIAYARESRIISQSLLGAADNSANSQSVPQTITASNLASVNANYTAARTKRIEAQQRWSTVVSQSASTLPEVQSNATIQSLIGQRSAKIAELAEMKTRYGSSYPPVLELQGEISGLTSQINKLSEDVKASIRQAYLTAVGQEKALSDELTSVSDQTLSEQNRRVQFNQLDRESKALATQLDNLLERYNQLAAASNIQPGTISLLDAATRSDTPVSPNLTKNMILAFILGGGLAVLIAIGIEVLDDKIHSVNDLQRKLGLKPLGQTPKIKGLAGPRSDHSLTEAYASIRAMLDFSLPAENHNVIMFTSSQPAEGKTTTAISLAIQSALRGQSVLLIECDLRKPSVSGQFNLPRPSKGLVEVLLGEATLEEALLNQEQANLDVLPVGKIRNDPVDVLTSKRFADFIGQMREKYDLVLLDSPPVIGLADAIVLARLSDGVIFVVNHNRAHSGGIKATVRRLRGTHANMLGAVLTQFDARDAGEDYYYYSDYYSYGDQKSPQA